MIHDVSCYHSFNSCRSTEPREFHSLNALLQTVLQHINREGIDFRVGGSYKGIVQWYYLEQLSYYIMVILCSFQKSFQTPQLVDLAASCVMGLVEINLLVYVGLLAKKTQYQIDEMYTSNLDSLETLLEQTLDLKFNDGNKHTSSIVSKISCRDYTRRLRYLQELLNGICLEQFPMIHKLFDYLDGCTGQEV